ncbi:MAG: hypothetical protein JXR83_06055, partial [Deltaproteobacteria bacterium]|nr:hypothetical protein [Deltaproteobacteria bacterium]
MSLSIALVTCWALAGAAQLGPDLETARAVSTAPAASAPAATSAPAVASPPRRRPLELEGCQQLLLDADYLAAQACYRGLARTESDPARIRAAAGLAELAAEMAPASASAPAETRPSAQVKPVKSSSGDAAVDYIAAGKAELVLASGVYGLWMGGLALATTWILLASAMPGSDLAWLFFTGMLMLPVAGGAAGLLGSGIATVAVPELSAGDTALMRMAMLAGPLNAISSLFLLSGLGISLGGTGSSSQPQMIPLWMLGVSGAPVVAAAAASALVDLPDGGPALATSAAIWGSAIALLGLGAAQLPGEQWPLAIGLIGVGADALALSALAVSPLLSVTRPDTWALDLGAA